jgi:hypothetical protein
MHDPKKTVVGFLEQIARKQRLHGASRLAVVIKETAA